jgi:hypothetical protein
MTETNIPQIVINRFWKSYTETDSNDSHWTGAVVKGLEQAMKPVDIESAPKDKAIMLYCPDDYPTAVAGIWFECEEWEGWMYADAALSDLEPTGPKPTGWYPLIRVE